MRRRWASLEILRTLGEATVLSPSNSGRLPRPSNLGCYLQPQILHVLDGHGVPYPYKFYAPPALAPALPAFFFRRSPVMRTPFCLYGSGGRSERMSAATWPTWPLSAPLTTRCVCFSTAI